MALVGIYLLERDGFEKIPIEVIREEYNRESLSLRSFIEDKCAMSLSKPEYYMSKDDFYESYLLHCEERKVLGGEDFVKPLTAIQVEVELSKYKVFEKRMRIDGVKRSCYKGIITTEEANKRNQEILEKQKQTTL